MNSTLFRYVFKKQLLTMLFVALSVFGLIWLFDFAEVSRKYPIGSYNELFFALRLSLLRAPITFCEILNYVYFITATFSLWDLCRSHQITIMKAIGRSPQQILFPFVSFSIFTAVSWLLLFHPVGIFTENLYKRSVEHSATSSFEKNTDVWIDYGTRNGVIFIKSIDKDNISDFCAFYPNKGEKIFAKSGKVLENFLILKDVSVFRNDQVERQDSKRIFSNISTDLLKLLSLPPHRQDIYSLYKIYNIQLKNGTGLRLYELALQKLLSTCASFVLFALIAAVICFPINRYKSKTNIALKVIFSALLWRFANSMFESLAYSGVMSVLLASWAVTLILMFLATAVLIWKEV